MKRLQKSILAVLLFSFAIAIGILIFVALGIMAIPLSVQGFFRRRAWLREMRASGRVRSVPEIVQHETAGTLIVDQPSFGEIKYCWWTPDDIESLAPFEFPIASLRERFDALEGELDLDSLPFDRWVFDRYLNDESGTALLGAVRKGDKVADEIRQQRADLKLIETWSGLLAFEEVDSQDQVSPDA